MVPTMYFSAIALALVQLVASSPLPQPAVPPYFQLHRTTRRNITTTTVVNELGPLLSNKTLIFGPDNPNYVNQTSRWVAFVKPDVEVIVEPTEESEIARIVKYCNDNSIEFLTRSRGHGVTTTMNSFKGLQISMVNLNGVQVQDDGETALVQGGVYAGGIIQTLWDQGYVTTTGAANCVGLGGLSLGGGHGRFEGVHGLVADGLVHLNIVLGDGSQIAVNATSHEDLFWAMRGAGHNFGIVTSAKVKIYPRVDNTWHYHTYVWTGDKLETVFEEINKFHKSDNGTTPVLMAFESGVFVMDPSISETEPILSWGFVYNGTAEDAEALLEPFNAIGAVSETVQDVPYIDVADIAGTGENGPVCQDGNFMLSNTLLPEYNITAQRGIYDLFTKKVAEFPELGSTGFIAHEGYANAAAKAVPSDSTAYPHRDQNHIVFFRATVPEGSDDLFEQAQIWAKESWKLWTDGHDPLTYVNYAWGHDYETLESMYGYEPWRLDRLRGLKAKYDPENRFRFYNPIVERSHQTKRL